MGEYHSLTEDYIEQYFECSKKLCYRDLTQESEGLITALYKDLPNAEIDGFPVASDFVDGNDVSYSYEEYAALPSKMKSKCRLRYLYLPNHHELIIGTTGSGKTTGCTEPQLRAISTQKNKPNLFISDPKGELFERNASHLRKQGYKKIFVLNFKEPMRSDRWNPLLELYDLKVKIVNTEEGFEKRLLETELDSFIHQITKSFIPVKNQRDPSWESGAQDLLKGIIYALLENIEKTDSGFTRDMMTISSIEHYYNTLKKEFVNVDGSAGNTNNWFTKSLSDKTRSFMSLTLDNAPNTKRNFFGTFEGAMNDWFTGHISTLTTGNTIEIDGDGDDDVPFVIFLITRDYDKSDFNIAGLFIDAVYKKMLIRAEKNMNGRNERATHFLLDEFGNIPEIKDFENKISTSRSRNIWFHLSVQSYMQLEVIYEKSRAAIIRDNCNSQIFLGSQNRETKEFFSKECGKHTIPTLSALYNDTDHSLNTVPLIPVSQLDLIKPGEMYIKRVYKPVFVSSFVRSYQAANTGVYKDFSGGFKNELPHCEKGVDVSECLFVPQLEEKQKLSGMDEDFFDTAFNELFKTRPNNSDSATNDSANSEPFECPKIEVVENSDNDCEAGDSNAVQNTDDSVEKSKAQAESENEPNDNDSNPQSGFEDFLSTLLEQSFTNRIKVMKINNSSYAIAFPMYKTSGGIYEIFLNATENGSYYLSDEGATFNELDSIFEMGEADVQKNIAAIINQYNCKMIRTNLIIDCSPYDVHVKMSYLIQAMSFMLNMKIFYI